MIERGDKLPDLPSGSAVGQPTQLLYEGLAHLRAAQDAVHAAKHTAPTPSIATNIRQIDRALAYLIEHYKREIHRNAVTAEGRRGKVEASAIRSAGPAGTARSGSDQGFSS